MPWVAVEQIASLLNLGGFVFTETHFSFMAHERPWNFFQFSDNGLRALFNPALGFEVIDAGASNPMMGYFDRRSDSDLRYLPVTNLYCHTEILCRKVREVDHFDWRSLSATQVAGHSTYPRLENEG